MLNLFRPTWTRFLNRLRTGAGLTPLPTYKPRRIALIKPSALGDIIHALPVLTALRRRFPSAQVTWVVNRGFETLLEGHPHLDAVLTWDRRATRQSWARGGLAFVRFLLELRRRQFDLVLDLQGLLRSGLMTWSTGAPRRIHAVDRYWLVAEALGAAVGTPTFHLPVPVSEQAWAAERLRGCPRPWLMIGVGASWMTKRWPPEHFATLALRAQAEFGGTAVFVGGKDEMPLARAAAVSLTGTVRDLTGQTTLPQLAAVLARADVMVANDTGPLHLAVALGRPVVAPYTCTRVQRTGPYGPLGRAVETRVWCQGSCLKTCRRLECMAELTPERLWPSLHEILTAWQCSSRSA
jgi:ADP-heptose:LPS heptosyltransferase